MPKASYRDKAVGLTAAYSPLSYLSICHVPAWKAFEIRRNTWRPQNSHQGNRQSIFTVMVMGHGFVSKEHWYWTTERRGILEERTQISGFFLI